MNNLAALKFLRRRNSTCTDLFCLCCSATYAASEHWNASWHHNANYAELADGGVERANVTWTIALPSNTVRRPASHSNERQHDATYDADATRCVTWQRTEQQHVTADDADARQRNASSTSIKCPRRHANRSTSASARRSSPDERTPPRRRPSFWPFHAPFVHRCTPCWHANGRRAFAIRHSSTCDGQSRRHDFHADTFSANALHTNAAWHAIRPTGGQHGSKLTDAWHGYSCWHATA